MLNLSAVDENKDIATKEYADTKAPKTEAIKNITRSGTTFTATRCDNTTFTFTQQDNNSVTGVKGNSESSYRTGNVNITAANVGAAPAAHASTGTTYGSGNASNYGHVKLSASTSSTSGESDGTAATPSAVKAAYDLANSAAMTSEFYATYDRAQSVKEFGYLGVDKYAETGQQQDFSKDFCVRVDFVRNSAYPSQRYCLASGYGIGNPYYPEVGIELASGNNKLRVYSVSDAGNVTDKYLNIVPPADEWSTVLLLWDSASSSFTCIFVCGNTIFSESWTPTGTYSGTSKNIRIGADSRTDSTWNCKYQQLDIPPIWYPNMPSGSEYAYRFEYAEAKNGTPIRIGATSYSIADLTNQIGTTTVGSASGWSAGTLPTKGTNIAADDITAWTTNTPTAVTPNTVVTGGTKTSIPNISKKTVVTGVTKKTVVTGGSTTSITPVTKKTVVTGVTKKTVVTGGSTTNITPVTKKTVVTAASGATATIANGILTITDGSFTTGDSVTEGAAVAAYTSLTTGDSVTVTTGDSVTTGTAVDVYTSLTTGDSVTVTTGDSVTVGTAIEAYTSLATGPACSVTAGTAASLSYTARSIPNITAVGTLPSLTITSTEVATIEE